MHRSFTPGRVLALAASGVVAGIGSHAAAQTSPLFNGSFEVQCFFCPPTFAEGWHSPGNNTLARRRFVGDGLTPAIQPVGSPGAITPRTGSALTSLRTAGAGGFVGVTTDFINFCYCNQACTQACPTPFPFFDPVFDYNGGDVVVRGWYMIPANDPITDFAGIKLNVKTLNQDVATIENLSITGHTNGEWRELVVTFPKSEIVAQYECNVGIRPDCGCVCVPPTPAPNRVKIVAFRFTGDGNPSSGTIYWDDISYQQLPAGPTCDGIDFNGDGIEQDPTDIEAFLSIYSGGPCVPPTATCGDIDFNNDGIEQDPTDIEAFLSVYSGGPCL